jgi:RNA polymerase sigma-70 factor, ECF subfamily
MSTDTELLARIIIDEDQQAFEVLVKKYQSALRAFFRKMCGGDENLSDDLAQETFIKAYKGIASYQGQCQFLTWLFAIAKNVFYESYRRNEKFIELVEDGEEASAETGQNLQMDLAKCMLLLDTDERMILTLSYMEGLSQTEVAELMKIPLGTVKTHALRAKEKLKSQMMAYQARFA